MVCRDFILPEFCKPCLFYSLFNLRNLLAPLVGLEPTTLRLAAACSTGWAKEDHIFSTSREERKSILALSLVWKPILCFYSDVADTNSTYIHEFITASDESATKIFQNPRASTVSSAQSSGYLRSCSLPTELKRIIYFSTSREERKSILALSLVWKPILCFYCDVADANFICIRKSITANDEFAAKNKK